ncbi:MAG: VOC family protein [candidate division Zixibacteria bacterium]|nr:VOC family protein [candidate division Zixibacteria bacterium]
MKKVNPIPKGYHTVTPYLTVEGTAKLIEFLKKAFDAKEKERMTRPDGTIGHAEVKIGDSIVMMGDAMGGHPARPTNLYLYVKNTDAFYKRALAAGAASTMEPQDMFWGDRNAGVKDLFGNEWWIATHKENVSPKEMKKRAEAYFKKLSQG